jgi:hypothetical protein
MAADLPRLRLVRTFSSFERKLAIVSARGWLRATASATLTGAERPTLEQGREVGAVFPPLPLFPTPLRADAQLAEGVVGRHAHPLR